MFQIFKILVPHVNGVQYSTYKTKIYFMIQEKKNLK